MENTDQKQPAEATDAEVQALESPADVAESAPIAESVPIADAPAAETQTLDEMLRQAEEAGYKRGLAERQAIEALEAPSVWDDIRRKEAERAGKIAFEDRFLTCMRPSVWD